MKVLPADMEEYQQEQSVSRAEESHLRVEREDGGDCEGTLQATLAGALCGEVLANGGKARQLAATRAVIQTWKPSMARKLQGVNISNKYNKRKKKH